jgi:uncharacterized damage-inducible protein DinB
MHTEHLAKHLRDVHFGGNWCCVNLKDLLADVSWQEATAQVYGLNSIATLTFHIGYYIEGVLDVLRGNPLTIKDKFSFEHPAIQTEADWQAMVDRSLQTAELFAQAIEQLPDSQLWEDFSEGKYGNYYRNLNGIIEHTHYHLGQIALLKKVLRGVR